MGDGKEMASPHTRSLEDRLARLQSLSEYKSGRRRRIILNNAAEVKLAHNILAELDTDKSGEISLAEIEAAEKRCREFAERSSSGHFSACDARQNSADRFSS